MFKTEVFLPSPSTWEEIKNTIISLEHEAFGDKAFTDEEISSDFLNEKNIIVLLKKEETSEIVGFVYAKPVEEAEAERVAEKGETAYLWDIIIKQEYRGQHLAGILMNKIEEELKSMNYKYMDLCAVKENNFAENISKTYQGRIVKSEPIDSKWGPQVFFRIRL